MTSKNAVRAALLACLATTMLAACGGGADGVASPGEGVFVPSPPPPAPPPPAGPPPPPPPGGPAAACPTGFTNVGIVANLRNCQLPALITGSLLIPNATGTIYSISGRVNVGQDLGPNPATPNAGAISGILSLEPGVRVFGSGTLDYIVVNRGSQINAIGTPASPIVFTSRQSVEGTTGVDSIGQWGGLVILGRAPTASGCPAGVTAPNILCDATVEGTNANYGGLTNTDNSGRLSYVRVQHSGFEVLPNQELNGITLAGVGNGTVVDHVQVHNSSDDGIEIFGGTVNLSHIVLTGNDDDSYDLDTGWRGGTQFLLAVQRPNGGDRAFEFSSAGAKGVCAAGSCPFNTQPRIANATLVSRTSGVESIVINSGNGLRLVNSIVTRSGGAGACLDVDDADTLVAGATFNSVFLSCTTAFANDTATVGAGTQAEAQALFAAGANNNAAGTTSLTAVGSGAVAFINGPNETATVVTTPVNTATWSTTFTNPGYVGAVQNGADTWYRGWTCSSLIGEEAC